MGGESLDPGQCGLENTGWAHRSCRLRPCRPRGFGRAGAERSLGSGSPRNVSQLSGPRRTSSARSHTAEARTRAHTRVPSTEDCSAVVVAPLPPVAVQPPAHSSKKTIVCHMDYTLNLRTDRPQLLCNVWRAERCCTVRLRSCGALTRTPVQLRL